ncbi:MAG: DUF1788 domain-containing protein [Candidatus Cloacimonetes bacterium]|nr:DUF1788 domain-containing protein [Candidatus Cloacimonadota bacterium]MDY0172641.1 DUF1788 domain-containing protein [Candidatus Cloacimonadaceae bacterium]
MKLHERADHLFKVISSERFMNKGGLGNEVPFFICPFQPKDAPDMERLRKQLINKLEQSGIQVLDINLYDLALEILEQNGDLEWYISQEQTMTKDELKDELQGILDVETILTPAIAERMQLSDFHVMFLSGVGEIFPYIRSHTILNNLQSTAKDKPTVMFFPGAYTQSLENGASLDLFGLLHDDKYYRAFNIYSYEV